MVLMAAYNGAAHIEDQIGSILTQRDVNVRILIRDDGSADGTIDAASRLSASHPSRITLVEDSHGPTGSAASNFGVMLRSCIIGSDEWVALADQDDIWFPDKLCRAIERLKSDDADAYSCNLIAFDDDANAAWQVRKDAPQREFDYLFQGASAGCTYVLSGRALAVVRNGIDRLGGRIPTHASHDWLIYALCRSAGLRWSMDRRARIAYRQHGRNVYGTKVGWARLRERARLVGNRWYRRNVMWLRTALQPAAEEEEILLRVTRLSLRDRLWLARHAGSFRRSRAEARQLGLALLTGLF